MQAAACHPGGRFLQRRGGLSRDYLRHISAADSIATITYSAYTAALTDPKLKHL